MARRAAVASIAVMGSRLLGLVREQVFAYHFGASREYDAFLTAFRVPNLLRDLLAEGALSAAFVTTFSAALAQRGRDAAFRLANLVLAALVPLLVALVVLGIACAPQLVGAIAVGFDADKLALSAMLTRLMFPYIALAAVAAVVMGMLNALDFYAVPQSASTAFNLVSICAGLGAAHWLAPEYMAGLATARLPGAPSGALAAGALGAGAARAMAGMAIGVLLGGVAQVGLQLPTLWRAGFRPRPAFDPADPGFRAVLRLMGPAVIGAAAVQLNVFVNSNFASTLGDRPISWLNYAFRLMQFPIGVFGVAVMTAAVPAMARSAAAGESGAFGRTLTSALELVLLLTLPSAVALASLGEPLIALIYERGRFGAADTAATAHALAAYAVGLPGYAAVKLVQPAFVARGDARTPMFTSMAGVAANAGLNFGLVHLLALGHVGLAASTSLVATGNVLVLLAVLRRRLPDLALAPLGSQASRIALACVALAAVALTGRRGIGAWCAWSGAPRALLELGLLGPLALAAFVGTALWLRVGALDAAASLVRRRLRRRAP